MLHVHVFTIKHMPNVKQNCSCSNLKVIINPCNFSEKFQLTSQWWLPTGGFTITTSFNRCRLQTDVEPEVVRWADLVRELCPSTKCNAYVRPETRAKQTRKMENYKYFCFSLYLCAVLTRILCIKLTDVTVDLFHSKTDGIVAAFGDFNADKLTDIFVVDDAGMFWLVFLFVYPKTAS